MKAKIVNPTVAVIDGAFSDDVCKMFRLRGFDVVQSFDKADAVVFTGGADISPSLYGERALQKTHSFSRRDHAEINIYRRFFGRPMIGICRGAQLLNVLCGGKLIQHVDNHNMSHIIYDKDRATSFLGTSIHHQMMIPGPKAKVLAVAGQATVYMSFDKTTEDRSDPKDRPIVLWNDIEAVAYEDRSVLCYQGHPERGSDTEQDVFFRYIEDYTGLVGMPIKRDNTLRTDDFEDDLPCV